MKNYFEPSPQKTELLLTSSMTSAEGLQALRVTVLHPKGQHFIKGSKLNAIGLHPC